MWPNQKQKDRAALSKQKIVVYISRLQKCVLNLILTKKKPKWQTNVPKGPKKVQKRPIMCTNQKQKDGPVLPKAKLIVYIGRFQICV